MITIVNVSQALTPFGVHEYEVRINAEVIATFSHKREDGLAECLRKAAKAVEQEKWRTLERMIASARVPNG